MTIEELEQRMNVTEFRAWQRFYDTRPPADERIADQLASLQATMIRINNGKATMSDCKIVYKIDKTTPQDKVTALRNRIRATAQQQEKSKGQ